MIRNTFGASSGELERLMRTLELFIIIGSQFTCYYYSLV